jgi:hypothetical protein
VTNVDSGDEDSAQKSTPDENECEKELVDGKKIEKAVELAEKDANQIQK